MMKFIQFYFVDSLYISSPKIGSIQTLFLQQYCQMNKFINQPIKSRQKISIKVPQSIVYKNINVKSKVSAVITPVIKQDFFRPKSSVADISHKEGSTGISASQSNKNIFKSQKLSPKASIGDIKQTGVQKRRAPNTRSKQKRITNLNSPRKIESHGLLKSPPVEKVKEEIKKSLANVINIYYPEQKNSPPNQITANTQIDTLAFQKTQVPPVSKNDFNFLEIIGRGGYGKVWKVEHKKSKKLFAMKQMSKAVIIMKRSVQGVQNQRKLLAKLKHSFLANMVAAFHDRDTLYLLMDLMPGGDLRYHVGQNKQFTQQQTRFFIACIIVALQYLHSKKVIHRDIKPQNLVLDAQGYVRVTDLGIARTQKDNNEKDTSGTPGYMAPEVLCKQSHTYMVDYFALGVITYEFMMGKRPYTGKSRNQIRQIILAKQVQIKKTEIPSGWSLQAVDFTNKLLQRQPKNRLGTKSGVQQIKDHPWLKKYPWKRLISKQLKAPYIPVIGNWGGFQQSEYDNEQLMQYKILQRLQDHKDLFMDYYYRSNEL